MLKGFIIYYQAPYEPDIPGVTYKIFSSDGKPFLGAESKREVWNCLVIFYRGIVYAYTSRLEY